MCHYSAIHWWISYALIPQILDSFLPKVTYGVINGCITVYITHVR